MAPDPALIPLHEWESFYVIIGTSAAALTGLMFVVIAVVADAGPRATTPLGIGTFVTPTIVHLCAALLISAILRRRGTSTSRHTDLHSALAGSSGSSTHC